MASQPTPLTYPPPRNKGSIRPYFSGNQWLISSVEEPWFLEEAITNFQVGCLENLLSEVRCIYHGNEKKHGGQDCWGRQVCCLLFVVFDWSFREKNIMRNFKELTSGFWNDWISGGFDSEDDTVDGSEIRLTSWYDKCPFLFFKYGFIHPKKVFVWDFWIINRQDFLYRSVQFRMHSNAEIVVGSDKFRPRRSQKLSRGYLLIS